MSEIKINPTRKRMKRARQAAGYTEKDMAAESGISKGTVWYYEALSGKPSDELVSYYAEFFGESERYLRTGRRK